MSTSADEHYQEARDLWSKAIDLGVYDDPKTVRKAAAILQRAVHADPNHIGALALLADLLAALPDYEVAIEFAQRVLELEPDGAEHKRRVELLALPDDQQKRRVIMAHLSKKWHAGEW